MQYLVLPDITDPYLLARVRWPDVCQAISVGRPVWQDDPGLFDLPYEPSSTPVTLSEAITIAARWGVRLGAEETTIASEALLIRRMPANWSNLSPAEKRAWSIEFVNPRRGAGVSTDDGVTAPASRSPRGRWRRRGRADAPAPQPVAVESAPITREAPVGGRAHAIRPDRVNGTRPWTLVIKPATVDGEASRSAHADGDAVIDLRDASPGDLGR